MDLNFAVAKMLARHGNYAVLLQQSGQAWLATGL
jgi:hypothetical protein